MGWTAEQISAINEKNGNILVSAAAGSGKTAVLVERIIKLITDEENPVDIDRLLVVTFTKAAAAEMKERIGAAVNLALRENPDSETVCSPKPCRYNNNTFFLSESRKGELQSSWN